MPLKNLLPENLPDAVREIHRILTKRRLTLSVAESCTGGLLSQYLTALPGSSEFFLAGVTAYSAYAKIHILGVPEDIINKHGTVSEQTARAMAGRVRKISGSDFGLSTTGNLGPDTIEGKERGLIYVAAAGDAGTCSRDLRLTGTRLDNREQAAEAALNLLLEFIN